jgi:protein-disulfide isomerase
MLINRLLWTACVSAISAFAYACPAISPVEHIRLERYVTQKYRIPEQDHIHLANQEVVNDKCYYKLVFSGQGPLGEIRLTLYGSPDLRFLSEELLDSYLDPHVEEQETARKAMEQLQSGEFASRGPKNASATLVEFSDFQCPFCRAMHMMLISEPLLKSGKIRFIYRHMPLSQHEWAQEAAEAAACAQFQSPDAFWPLHDALFENQSGITRDNIHSRINSFAASIPSLNLAQFKDCLDRQTSLGVVIRDQEIGTRIGVQGTPTLFLNGRRLPPASTPAELHRVLEEALKQGNIDTGERASRE